MTTYNPFRKFDIVKLVKRTEVENLLFLDETVLGVVTDRTVPDYYLVKFEGYGAYWVDGSKLQLVKNNK